METIGPVRRANLLLLLDEIAEQLGGERGSAAELAARTGIPAAYISQIRRQKPHSSGAQRSIGDDVARKAERGMGKPTGWMDHPHETRKDMGERDFLRLYRLLTAAQREHLRQSAELFLGVAVHDADDDAPGIQPGTQH